MIAGEKQLRHLLGVSEPSGAPRLNERTRLLVVTSTFPRWVGDHEPPFVYELCRRLGDTHAVTVLAPHAPGARAGELHGDRLLPGTGSGQQLDEVLF